jgi:UDPglucose--hexose-1-phosphate uridylyltransferase
VTITSHRNQRPWSSADTQASELANTAFDDSCYLCPGNTRVSGRQNEQYQSIFVFTNDHPAFSPDAPTALTSPPGIYQNARATGTTRVMCYSPHHSTSLAELPLSSHEQVLATWAEQTREMLAQPDIEQVLIFENKGEVIGVSNPHPHCQIYGASFEFKHLEVERLAMEAHRQETDRHLMADIIASETETNSRLVARTDTALSFLPYFSRFPFETFVVPLQAHNYLYELTAAELTGLARVLQETLIRFDNLWRQPFPYMLVLHQAPRHYQGQYHCHIQIHPLMRQPNLQKFLAGVETGGGHFLNDVDPDGAAAQLRALPDKHFAQ